MEDMMQDDQNAAKPAVARSPLDPVTTVSGPAIEQAAVAESSVASDTDKAIDTWWFKISRNSPLSRNTAALNHVQANLPALKEALGGGK